MKYIKKDFADSVVVAYEDELKENQLDKSSLANHSIHPALQGRDVYDQIKSFKHFKDLKDKMFQDQGGICCYCGQALKFRSHPPYIVEHVTPRETCRELAGEYENLLLSCRPTDEEETERTADNKKKNNEYWHCDKLKGHKVLTYTPLQQSCNTHFSYHILSGEVEGLDADAENDIKTLGLNCDYLKRRRKAAIYAALYDENGILLSNNDLKKYMSIVMNRKKDDTFPEFCFVIAGAIENFLNGEPA
jgi:uncharacterized protein (TIGR02646 family)